MTNPEDSQQGAELNPESPTDETTAGVTDEASGADEASSVGQKASDAEGASDAEETTGFDAEAAQEGVTADYQERIREFDEVESVPVTSMPVPTSELDESDLKVESPGGQGG
ncbi:MAG TPA: hypothetical protein VNA67_02280 [Pseudonocardiaceae bacterium]|nr:hypothetical protein [Pseudonocardiaceae bacterium]